MSSHLCERFRGLERVDRMFFLIATSKDHGLLWHVCRMVDLFEATAGGIVDSFLYLERKLVRSCSGLDQYCWVWAFWPVQRKAASESLMASVT